jgi:HAD superfamily hydrolase (TIGR01458 family)
MADPARAAAGAAAALTAPGALPPVRAVLLDLDGTVCVRGRPVEGAAAALTALRAQGLPLRFLTNIDSRTPDAIADELSGLGLPVSVSDLFTPVSAAAAVIRGTDGARVYGLLSAALLPVVPRLATEPPYTHVLVGDCRDVLDYPRLDAAFRALRDGAQLLALQRGRYFRSGDGDHVDTGAVVAGLEYAAGATARVLGKPSADFFALAAAGLGARLAECVVVGDDATTDIRGGRAAGAVTVQVRTGKFADQDAEGLTGGAHLTLDSVADLPGVLRMAP